MIDTTSHVFPPRCDLRPSINQVEQQSFYPACLGNAGASLGEVLSERMHDKIPAYPILNLSRFYLYYWLRNFSGRVGLAGGQPIDLMHVLQIKGVCDESLWPYIAANEHLQPPLSCDLATAFKIWEFDTLIAAHGADDWALAAESTRTNIKHALCQGRPVLVSMNITKDFQDQGHIQNGCRWQDFRWDAKPSATNTNLGGHEVLAIGYDDPAGMILMQGSYGPDVADGGFFGLPYELFEDMINGVTTAFYSVKDTVGNVPVADYLPKIYDPARAELIRDYLAAKFPAAEISATAKQYAVPGDEMDAAMQWPPGRARDLFGI